MSKHFFVALFAFTVFAIGCSSEKESSPTAKTQSTRNSFTSDHQTPSVTKVESQDNEPVEQSTITTLTSNQQVVKPATVRDTPPIEASEAASEIKDEAEFGGEISFTNARGEKVE